MFFARSRYVKNFCDKTESNLSSAVLQEPSSPEIHRTLCVSVCTRRRRQLWRHEGILANRARCDGFVKRSELFG
ncbi:hypothetical protein OESDEN_06351 [Oesophagostomum dentatum]|uniref:Uncharacterized protein n=1 Tax=Oesophagostomum dentatum TaxID=61180 RepID=A0A0B1T863_OESDE|nr:hypothetical protein OESDEN_06351 [Oesophagostomum dentatum]